MVCGTHWSCISGCGACCRLDPEERSEALDALNPQQRETYLSMVGADGWCRHFDTGSRRCRIYAERPDFCQVSQLAALFQVPPAESEAFAIRCCQEQIRSEFGGRSRELRRFERATRRAPAPLNSQPNGQPCSVASRPS